MPSVFFKNRKRSKPMICFPVVLPTVHDFCCSLIASDCFSRGTRRGFASWLNICVRTVSRGCHCTCRKASALLTGGVETTTATGTATTESAESTGGGRLFGSRYAQMFFRGGFCVCSRSVCTLTWAKSFHSLRLYLPSLFCPLSYRPQVFCVLKRM